MAISVQTVGDRESELRPLPTNPAIGTGIQHLSHLDALPHSMLRARLCGPCLRPLLTA